MSAEHPKLDRTGTKVYTESPKNSLLSEDKITEILEKVQPLLSTLSEVLDVVGPKVNLAYEYAKKGYDVIEPYHPEHLLPVFIGLIMIYFGGYFFTTIAAVEAFRLCGYDKIKENTLILVENYRIAKEASDKDNLVDDDNDGIADVLQISKKELTTRKIKLVLRTVDPSKVTESFFFFQCSCFAVLATLRAQFALAITLGSSIGETLEDLVSPVVQPALRRIIPAEYHKWVPILVAYTTKSIGVSVAWSLLRVVGAFHSSIRGGFLLVKGLLYYGKLNGLIDDVSDQTSALFMGLGSVFALSGFYTQLISGFELPFPLSLILLPLTMFESFLIMAINWA